MDEGHGENTGDFLTDENIGEMLAFHGAVQLFPVRRFPPGHPSIGQTIRENIYDIAEQDEEFHDLPDGWDDRIDEYLDDHVPFSDDPFEAELPEDLDEIWEVAEGYFDYVGLRDSDSDSDPDTDPDL